MGTRQWGVEAMCDGQEGRWVVVVAVVVVVVVEVVEVVAVAVG